MSGGSLWQIDIQKRLGNEFWTNVYHVNEQGRDDAIAGGWIIAQIEQNFHSTDVIFTSMRVRPYPEGGEGSIVALGLMGEANAPNYLPLFNVVRVDFPVSVGRPSRKYYRCPIDQSQVVDGVFITTFKDGIQGQMTLLAQSAVGPSLVDVDGQSLQPGVVFFAVGMRQLRRGSKRKTQPVIPVSPS